MKAFYRIHNETVTLLGLAVFPLSTPVIVPLGLFLIGGPSAENFGLFYALLAIAALPILAIGLYDCPLIKRLTFLLASLIMLNILVPFTNIQDYGFGLLIYVVAFGTGVVSRALINKLALNDTFFVRALYTAMKITGLILIALSIVGVSLEVNRLIISHTEIGYALVECSRAGGMGFEDQADCFNYLAKNFESWAPDLCDQLRLSSHKQHCLDAIAVNRNDILVCYEFEQYDSEDFKRDQCLRNFLGLTSDRDHVCRQLAPPQSYSCNEANERLEWNLGKGLPAWY